MSRPQTYRTPSACQPSSLTPTLSRWERENGTPRWSASTVTATRKLDCVFPSPSEGEGRGEGENVRLSDRLPMPTGRGCVRSTSRSNSARRSVTTLQRVVLRTHPHPFRQPRRGGIFVVRSLHFHPAPSGAASHVAPTELRGNLLCGYNDAAPDGASKCCRTSIKASSRRLLPSRP